MAESLQLRLQLALRATTAALLRRSAAGAGHRSVYSTRESPPIQCSDPRPIDHATVTASRGSWQALRSRGSVCNVRLYFAL